MWLSLFFARWKSVRDGLDLTSRAFNPSLRLSGVVLSLAFLLNFTAASALADTFTVETLTDEVNGTAGDNYGCDVIGSGPVCTLRGALLASNLSTGVDDSIVFAGGLTGTIILNSGSGFGELAITDGVTITGTANCARNLTISGNNTSRIFHVNPNIFGENITVSISGLTLANGNGAANVVAGLPIAPGPGGAILTEGGATLNLTGMNLTGNKSEILGFLPVGSLVGGGVATIGSDTAPTVTSITRSLIQNNGALGGGGGIANSVTGLNILASTTNVTNSTIAFNAAGSIVDAAAAGGILNAGGTVNITNGTIAYNQAMVTGGGIVNVAGVPPLGTVTLRNTLIAENSDLFGLDLLFPDAAGAFNSLGNNLVGNSGLLGLTSGLDPNVTLFGGIPSGALVDIIGSVQIGYVEVDPLLGPLQNNGGCTDTMAVFNGSPAIDRGNNCVQSGSCSTFDPMNPTLVSDQRSSPFLRRFDGDNDSVQNVDIGSFEVQSAPTAAQVTVLGRVSDWTGRALPRTTVFIANAYGESWTALTNGFGYFRFDNIEAGESYVIGARSKQYRFEPQILNLDDSAIDVSIVAVRTMPAKNQ